jgi:hypothetical protein
VSAKDSSLQHLILIECIKLFFFRLRRQVHHCLDSLEALVQLEPRLCIILKERALPRSAVEVCWPTILQILLVASLKAVIGAHRCASFVRALSRMKVVCSLIWHTHSGAPILVSLHIRMRPCIRVSNPNLLIMVKVWMAAMRGVVALAWIDLASNFLISKVRIVYLVVTGIVCSSYILEFAGCLIQLPLIIAGEVWLGFDDLLSDCSAQLSLISYKSLLSG